MNYRTWLMEIAVLGVAIFNISCSRTSPEVVDASPRRDIIQVPSPSPRAETTRTIADQAHEQAELFWNKRIARCGESYFFYFGRNKPRDLVEAKLVTLVNESSPLSDVDKLNGIEWSSRLNIDVITYRKRRDEPGREWGDWQTNNHGGYQGGEISSGTSVTMQKKNGRWIVEEPGEFQALHYMLAANCSVSSNGEVLIHDPDDLSETYGYLKPYIFNKKTLVIFATPEQFFADSGRTSFEGLKCETVTRLPAGLHYVDGKPLTLQDYRRIERGQ